MEWMDPIHVQLCDADPKPSYDNARYCAIQITASQLDQLQVYIIITV